ncbi:MAG: hypothetical protein IJA10_12335 [Lachnospiraceae bacterium]|nr:hypothetical protein [Lachnospiraceae bacterium]
MKSKKKQIFCLVFTLFAFFLGMCFEHIEADSMFVFTSEEEPLFYVGTCDVTISDTGLCTTEMLGLKNLSYVGQYANKTTYSRKNFEVFLEFLCVDADLCSTSIFFETVNAVSFHKLRNHFIVLNYIHNADGKKRSEIII